MGGAEIDGEPDWNKNVNDSVNVACEWLNKIINNKEIK